MKSILELISMTSEVKIDFDYASKEWRKNKIRVGNGFDYCCGHLIKIVDGIEVFCHGPPWIWCRAYREKFGIRSRKFGHSKCSRHITAEEKAKLLSGK
jgi:hypothetical protein